jgi:hypothetical protein
MSLHRCRRKRWGRCEGCAGNRPDREAVRNPNTDGWSLVVEVGHRRIGRKVEATGTGVGNASVGGR